MANSRKRLENIAQMMPSPGLGGIIIRYYNDADETVCWWNPKTRSEQPDKPIPAKGEHPPVIEYFEGFRGV